MKIYDLTLPITPTSVVWPGDPPITMSQPIHLDRGDICTVTHINMSVHTGTHLDAPAHFISGGAGIESLALETLVGPALLVEAMTADEITADVLASLDIPTGTERLLLKTRNSARWQAGEKTFHEGYVAVTGSGAAWLVEHGVKLIGVDYLSVAPYADLITCHQILLGAKIIPVEGLNMHDVPPGHYQLICLPTLIEGSDGAPCRTILMPST